MGKRKLIIVLCGVLVLAIAGLSIYLDVKRNSGIESIDSRPSEEEPLKIEVDDILFELDNGATDIDWSRLDDTLTYIDKRYDCADFRLQHLIRILYLHRDKIPDETYEKIKSSLLGFKYWMNEAGEDSMCAWSENHQILFASSEYLIGQLFYDDIFLNNGMTGKERMENARVRILDWLEMRWNYGFIEYYSNVYYNEDVAPMANLMEFSSDLEIINKTTIVMDLLVYDIASQMYNGAFVTVSGRAYENNRKGGSVSSGRAVTEYLFDIETGNHGANMAYCFTSSPSYEIPKVLRDIGLSKEEVIIKASNGLNISELKKEGFDGIDEHSIMMQWGIEAFINASVVRNTLGYIRENEMYSNEFLSPITVIDIMILDILHLEPLAVNIIDPQEQGKAIQRGNTYTYKNASFSMYTTQSYFPGTYADQQHVQGVNVNEETSVFHTHPALEEGKSGQSPNYWVSYGHFPHAVQDENIQLAIYNIPDKKGMMEKALLDYTHMFFDKKQYDEVILEGNYIFGQLADTYIAVIGYNDLNFKEDSMDDVIQEGKQVFYITQMETTDDFTSLDDFIKHIKSNELSFDKKSLELKYMNQGIEYSLEYDEDFKINDQVIDTDYSRYDSPYANAEQKDNTITFNYNGKTLLLNFDEMIREIKN